MKKLPALLKIAAMVSGASIVWGMTDAALALTISPSSYDMPDGDSGTYQYKDSTYNGINSGGFLSGGTGKLTDGVIATESWNINRNPYVGWFNNPTITFNFTQVVNIDELTLSVDDSNNTGGVTTPGSVDISMNGININRTIVDPPSSNPFSETFSGLGLSGTSLDLTINDGKNTWIMVSEVSFEGSLSTSVPFKFSPTLGLISSGGFFGVNYLRKSLAARKQNS